jgi:hypothetical protein
LVHVFLQRARAYEWPSKRARCSSAHRSASDWNGASRTPRLAVAAIPRWCAPRVWQELRIERVAAALNLKHQRTRPAAASVTRACVTSARFRRTSTRRRQRLPSGQDFRNPPPPPPVRGGGLAWHHYRRICRVGFAMASTREGLQRRMSGPARRPPERFRGSLTELRRPPCSPAAIALEASLRSLVRHRGRLARPRGRERPASPVTPCSRHQPGPFGELVKASRRFRTYFPEE